MLTDRIADLYDRHGRANRELVLALATRSAAAALGVDTADAEAAVESCYAALDAITRELRTAEAAEREVIRAAARTAARTPGGVIDLEGLF